jgi:hypothetical protein
MPEELIAMQARRKDLIQMTKGFETGSMTVMQGGGRRLLATAVSQLAALKIEIAELELRIIVAGGGLTD